jgi:hypothetical protein
MDQLLTIDEQRFLLQQRDNLQKLASFNRIRAARFQTELTDSVELLNRARQFEALERGR